MGTMAFDQFVTRLDAFIERYDQSKHPFWVKANAGDLTREQFSHYIAQRWWFTVEFPMVLAGMMSRMKRDLASRRRLMANLMDEEVGPSNHIALFLRMAKALGWSEEQLHEYEEFPETVAMRVGFLSLMNGAATAESLTIGYVTEGQVPRYHWVPKEALEQRYGLSPDDYEWLTIHSVMDEEHGRNYLRALERHLPSREEEQQACLRAAHDALRLSQLFHDGLYRRLIEGRLGV